MSNLIPPSLAKLGFTDKPGMDLPSLSICSSGLEKKGKTHFAFTAPGPIAVIASDTGTLEIADKFRRQGKAVYYAEYEMPRGSGSARQAAAEKTWNKVEDFIYGVAEERSIRTFIGDTGTEFWELLRLARFGKLTQVMPHHYGPVNEEFQSMVKRIAKRPGLNSIWIHKAKKEYKTNKEGKDAWTGRHERAGFGDMGYLCDVVITHHFDTETREFYLKVADSRKNTQELIGLELRAEMCDFPTLAQLAYPESDPSYWL